VARLHRRREGLVEGGGVVALHVLGAVGGTCGGAALDLGGRRQRAVLAALVIARGEAVLAERLADCVWGDAPPRNAGATLQTYVSHLRRGLEPQAAARSRGGVIAKVGPGYALRLGQDAVDAWRFEAAVAAAAALPPSAALSQLDEGLALWRGPAYAEYAGEAWAEAEVARLDALRSVARERRLAAKLELGQAALVVPELEALVAEDPLREERWRLLVLALYRSQRQADALAALRRARAELAEALGVDPGPELRALEREVLAQSPALDAPAAPADGLPGPEAGMEPLPAPAAPSGEGAEAPVPPSVQPLPGSADLADRERETAEIAAALAGLEDRTGRVVLIEGPAGIGKTRLLAEATRLALTGGHRVLSARGSQLERSFGFGVVRQLLEPCVLDPEQRDGLLGGAAASATGVFEQVADDQRADGTFAVLHGLYWLTINLAAAGPVVLTIDDVQWCDPASLRFLTYLVRRLDAVPVLLLLTQRTGEPQDADLLLAELALDPAVTTLRPRPLSPAATTLLVRERLGEPAAAFVEACHRTTSGNPLLLRQLLRALEAERVDPDVAHSAMVRAVGSRAVAGLVDLRLRRMPEDARTVARGAAILGPGADLTAMAALAGLPDERAAAALEALVRGEILAAEHDGFAFVHPLVRDAVYESLPIAERALQHERAAAVLEERATDAERVAAHLLLAPRRGRAEAVEVLRAAARTALARGAADSAVVLLRRAVEEPASGPDHVALLAELGLAETLVDGPAAVRHLSACYDLLPDPAQRAGVALPLAATHLFASPPGVATAFAADAAAALPDALDDARQGLVALARTAGSMHGLPPQAYREGTAPEVRGHGDGARMLAATLSYERLLDGRDRPGTIELARFALEGDRLLEVDNGLFWVFAATVLLVADGDLPTPRAAAQPPGAGLRAFWERARQRAHARGSVFAAMSANLWRGFTRWRFGALGDALESLAEAREQNAMWGDSPVGATYVAAFTAGVHLDRGDRAAARRIIDGAAGLPPVGEGTRLLHESGARLLLAEGRPHEALEVLDGAAEPLGIRNPAWSGWRSLRAGALAAVGAADDAVALVEEEIALLRAWGAPTALGASLRLLGELRGDDAPLREAVDQLAGSWASLELARARLALGRSAGLDHADAVPLLLLALDGARTCGAGGVAADAVAALVQRGAEALPSGDPETQATERDRRILELSEAGLGLIEVAQELGVAPGTVRSVLAPQDERTQPQVFRKSPAAP
jgi:DNA-binding SARP family transcriptional activator/tetratricopeptide (TPR) repeat protein